MKKSCEHMGVSKGELGQLLQKYNDFLNTLNPAQKRAFLKSQKSLKQGADSLDDDVTPERLEIFLKTHAPPDGFICIMCDEDFKHKHR